MENGSYLELAELAGGFIHEIKNHLSTLGLNLQLLAEDSQEPETQQQRRALDRIRRLEGECQRLVHVSNDFLRFARVKDLSLRPASLAQVVGEITDFFGPMARSSGIEIRCYVPVDLPPVDLDPEMFKQAILNLLLNAQQAMPAGGAITIQASRSDEGLCLSLIDTGKGMTAEVVARAFKPFYTTRAGGSGLGLPTTRKIVEAHGGTIALESEPGHGTKFTILLPAPGRRGAAPAAPLACVDGQLMPLDEVKVSAMDRGFVFGDAIYEVLRVYRGRPWLADEHFLRLERSLAAIRLGGVDVGRLRERMNTTLEASKVQEGMVYIQVTRGSAPRSHPFPPDAHPLELLYVQALDNPYREGRTRGVKLSLQPDLRWKRCDIKSTNLLGNVLAIQAAREVGAAEAILHLPDGTLTECSHSSFLAVRQARLITTPLGQDILPGVTRAFVLELAGRLGIPVDERHLRREELAGLDELFLTGTTSEVMPVVQVDDLTIGTGQPGPITRRLQEAYTQAVERWLAGGSA